MAAVAAARRVAAALWIAAVIAAALAAAGLLGLDRRILSWSLEGETSAVWGAGVDFLDLVAGKDISSFLLGALLLAAAALARFVPALRRRYRPILYLALVQSLSSVAADLSKPPFGRLRPWESLEQASGADMWFVGANSFPSGHAGFYAGLFVPLMLLFPRWAAPLALPPLFVAAARVMERDHYLSDVSASAAVAILLALSLRFLLRPVPAAPR